MKQEWLGKRSNSLCLTSARHRSMCELKEAASILHESRAVLEERMTATLACVRDRALRSPVYAAERSIWERVRGLDDLTHAPCTSSMLLPTMTDEAPDWSKWIADETVVAAAATSGSTGRAKVMPFTQRSLEQIAYSCFPSLAHIALERGMPAKRLVLALTGPKGYVSYLGTSPVLAAAGYDVLQIPLTLVLSDPGVAFDLIEWLLEPTNEIHVISTVTAMLPLLIATLEEQPGGVDALDKLSHSLRALYTGGSELTPALEAMLSRRMGLPPGSYFNAFGSTEAAGIGCSIEDFSLFHGSLHSHVLSILALDELEKAESDPGYVPKSVLLTRAPVGLVGELTATFNGAIPWINLRQGDTFEVMEPAAGSDVPRLRYLARMSSVQDVGGGRVWPASYRRAMDGLGSKVTDYLAMALKPGDPSPDGVGETLAKDALLFFYEGTASLKEAADAIFEAIPILMTTGPKLGLGTFDMTVSNVRAGALRRCRQRKSQERGGAPGPLKHQVVRGPQYRVPIEDVLDSGPGWIPTARVSETRLSSACAEQHSEDEGACHFDSSSSVEKVKAG